MSEGPPASGGGSKPGGEDSYRLDLTNVFYVLALITLVVFVLVQAAEQLVPVVIAILIWFFVNAIANGLSGLPVIRRILPHWLAVVIAAVLTVGTVIYCIGLVADTMQKMAGDLTGFQERGRAALATIEEWLRTRLDLDIGLDVDAAVAIEWLQEQGLQEFLGGVLAAVTGFAGNLSIILLFVLFLLLDQPYFTAKLRALTPDPARYDRVREVLDRIGRDIRLYVWLMTLISITVGLGTYAICEAFGVQGAIFWGFLAFALNYIPTIGTILGVLFPMLFAIVQLEPQSAVAMAAALGAVQFVMGNILMPRLTGGWLNLSEFVVIFSLTIWGAMWGVAGLFLAVPMMMVLAIVLSQFDATRPVAILLSKNGKFASR